MTLNLMSERIVETLPNGLRVVTARSDGSVAYIGMLANAGSRDDNMEPDAERCRDGLAHFVEHTIFKGTQRRRPWQISNRMELVGGELNAYTTKEEIMVYANAPAGYESRAIELLADMAGNACFPQSEIDVERGVVLEEIHSYRDNADCAVFDEFDEIFYSGSELAHNILGYAGTVENLRREDARRFLEGYFAPSDMVVYCVSPGDPVKNLRLIEKYFGGFDRTAAPHNRVMPETHAPFDERKARGNHQANTLMGVRMFGNRDPRRYALFLLANILGGPAMNSRLNRELREHRGLVYTVECIVSMYSDTGAFQIYFGSEPDAVDKCTHIVRREIERLADAPLSARTFADAKRQFCGQLLVRGDNREGCAMGMAKSLMRHGDILDHRHTASQIMQLSATDLQDMAVMIASAPFSRLVIV